MYPEKMSLFSRLLKSIQDGSFAFKILNRISPIEYVPGPEKEINEYLAKHYPRGENWRALSPAGRKTWIQFHPVFNHHKIQIIAYVGANEGHTALALNEVFPGREFFLFEPAPQTFNILVEKTKQHKNMHCLNIAAGSKEEYRQMLVDEFSPASSLLPYEPIALQEYPFLGRQHNVNVNIMPLDLVMKEKKIDGIDLLLMDVQGYENEVLLGAKETLKSCQVIISELSLQALYKDSSTFDSVYQALARQGFQLRYLLNPMQGESHQILQIDGIFMRVQHD
jgi:FkbM family methyltransferase